MAIEIWLQVASAADRGNDLVSNDGVAPASPDAALKVVAGGEHDRQVGVRNNDQELPAVAARLVLLVGATTRPQFALWFA